MSGPDVSEIDPRAAIKARGIHETPPELARLLAELALEALEEPARNQDDLLRVFDPACGGGELLAAVAQTYRGRRPLHLEGYESDARAVDRARRRLAELPHESLRLRTGDFLEAAPEGSSGFDLIVANPPFVRTQILGARRARELSRRFGLNGRVDMYQVFAQAMTAALRPGGVLGLIAPNRLLSVRSGASVRGLLGRGFDLRFVLDLGDTKLFSAAVLPVLIVARRVANGKTTEGQTCAFTRVYLERPRRDVKLIETVPAQAGTILDMVRRGVEGTCRVGQSRYVIERGHFSPEDDPGASWSLTPRRDTSWLRRVEDHAAERFGSIGQVRVGIKTTADAVFVRDDWHKMPASYRPEPSLLKPLLTHRQASRWRGPAPSASSVQMLYPHEVVDGKRRPIDLAAYPKAQTYLERHRERLEGRSYLREAGRKWYEIWVPQDPSAWSQPKLVFPDIAEEPRAFLDETGALVQGDCYWLCAHPGRSRGWLLLALAVLNSTLATAYYDARFHNKLYNGRRRFITQYVARFPIPDYGHPAAVEAVERVETLVLHARKPPAARLREHEQEIDRLVWRAFGLDRPARS